MFGNDPERDHIFDLEMRRIHLQQLLRSWLSTPAERLRWSNALRDVEYELQLLGAG